jgi:hypothetical protein
MPFSRNSVLQRKCLPPNFSKSMGSNVRLKTYLVQVKLLYTLSDFEDRSSSGGREKLGVPKFFDPQQFRPLVGGTPEFRKFNQVLPWEHSQEISLKSIEPFPSNSTIHFGYFTPSEGRNYRPHIWQVRKRKKIDVDRILFS